jgi:excisionase family DNA binding protein
MNSERPYISLQEAAQYCDYSQEYLSLRARQKKLQAVKIGRNWRTTREWLDEYVARAAEYKKRTLGKGKETPGRFLTASRELRLNRPLRQSSLLPGHSFTPRGDARLERPLRQSSLPEPPANLPVYAPDADMWEDNRPEEIVEQLAFLRRIQFATAVSLAALLFFVAFFSGQEQFAQVLGSSVVQAYSAAVGSTVSEYFQWLSGLW